MALLTRGILVTVEAVNGIPLTNVALVNFANPLTLTADANLTRFLDTVAEVWKTVGTARTVNEDLTKLLDLGVLNISLPLSRATVVWKSVIVLGTDNKMLNPLILGKSPGSAKVIDELVAAIKVTNLV
jgi:hypothetical protein